MDFASKLAHFFFPRKFFFIAFDHFEPNARSDVENQKKALAYFFGRNKRLGGWDDTLRGLLHNYGLHIEGSLQDLTRLEDEKVGGLTTRRTRRLGLTAIRMRRAEGQRSEGRMRGRRKRK